MLLKYSVLLFSSCMLIISFLLEFVVGLSPCIICEVQRMILIPIIIFTVISFINKPIINIVLSLFRFIFVGIGSFLGWHHMQLLGKGAEHPDACLPDIFTIISYQGIGPAWQQILKGGPSCHTSKWELLNFSLPELTFAAYMALLLLLIFDFVNFLKKIKRNS